MIKRNDTFLIIGVLFASALIYFAFSFFNRADGKTVKIRQNNETVFEGRLSDECELDLGTNHVIIKDSSVKMESSDCKNQICVKHKEISKKGESIVCLPNKVIIEIE